MSETKTETKTEAPNIISRERLENLKDLNMIAEGKDPKAQQMINDFMRLDSPIERTNLRTKAEVQFISWLEYTGMSLYPNLLNDPFRDLSRVNAIANMARDGMKSNQVVELLRNTTDLSSLQVTPQDVKQGYFSNIFRREKPE